MASAHCAAKARPDSDWPACTKTGRPCGLPGTLSGPRVRMYLPSKWMGRICDASRNWPRSEEHTSELQSPCNLVCRLLLEKTDNIRRSCSRSHAAARPHSADIALALPTADILRPSPVSRVIIGIVLHYWVTAVCAYCYSRL